MFWVLYKFKYIVCNVQSISNYFFNTKMRNYTIKMTHTFLIVFLALSLVNNYLEIQDREIRNFELSDCIKNLNSRNCYRYMNN